MSDLDVGRLADGDAGDRGVLVDQKLGCAFGWRWVILFSGWFSFALFSATLYTSGKFLSVKTSTNCRKIYFTIDQYDVHCVLCRSLLCHLPSRIWGGTLENSLGENFVLQIFWNNFFNAGWEPVQLGLPDVWPDCGSFTHQVWFVFVFIF